MIIGCLGDSITAGSPLWDPDEAVRARIENPDERSQWEWWAMRADANLDLRNHGVYGERTDQIAERLEAAVAGAEAIVIQGGINDIVQSRPVEEALKNLTGMVWRARRQSRFIGHLAIGTLRRLRQGPRQRSPEPTATRLAERKT